MDACPPIANEPITHRGRESNNRGWRGGQGGRPLLDSQK